MPATSANGEDEIVYFAEMPAGGEALCLRGAEGLATIISAIKKQLDDKHQVEKLELYASWLRDLTDAAQEYERVLIEIANDDLRWAQIIHILWRRERALMQSLEDVAAFVLASKSALKKRNDAELGRNTGYSKL